MKQDIFPTNITLPSGSNSDPVADRQLVDGNQSTFELPAVVYRHIPAGVFSQPL
jgi:hypothetical protein